MSMQQRPVYEAGLGVNDFSTEVAAAPPKGAKATSFCRSGSLAQGRSHSVSVILKRPRPGAVNHLSESSNP